ncbi:NAD(P)H-dependent oxidoreductase [Xylocopilactobacillus apicola]|uniref:NAD(P)H dehydrogenase n=1 Tax=Xylocopilactobacillus apicola TaxID=2932184 RepID=A0AAU9D2Z5_9LACO|nr:NAD(P)H-dependent oxidoreductase [Xylocopilactobacillus apicola]BDR58134.1 NAD(P)H dehydrogenase [Xylocopilactobacillus apicola]
MIKYLIIYCHPWPKSFNHAILEAIIKNLEEHNQSYRVIDLYAERFDPVYDETGAGTVKYLLMLANCERLILVLPIWHNGIPGLLKGFIYKLKRVSGGQRNLTNIKQALILSTSSTPTFYYKYLGGNILKKDLIKRTLKPLGIKKVRWINFGSSSRSTKDRREKFLMRVSNLNL